MDPSFWRLVRFETLHSTSDHCIACAEAGEPEGLAVLADVQTKARGSRGRSWTQASGTLALSVLLRPEGVLRNPVLWPFLSALAFHDAVSLTPGHAQAIRIKWPNDLLLSGRKLGGILVESASQAEKGWLVIGFGGNLAAAPELAERQAACLAELGKAPSADAVAAHLLAALCARMEQARAHGFGAIRADWLARAHPTGTMLAVRTPDGQTRGSFSSIAEDGTLLLDVAGEIRRIVTGEVLQAIDGGQVA